MHQHIADYLRHAASRNRTTERSGPFLLTFASHSTNPFLNYAIPDGGATPTRDEITSLVAAFHQRDLLPRLEYVPDTAPDLEPLLLTAGFVVEERMPMMICPPADLVKPALPPGITIASPATDDDLIDLMTAQNEAYGEGPPDTHALAERRAFIAAGGIALLARDAVTGEAIGGGLCSVPYLNTTELTSVGIREPFRRRGIAAALTGVLTQAAFDVGVTTVFLMAAHEAEARIYARAGFKEIGVVLAIALTAH